MNIGDPQVLRKIRRRVRDGKFYFRSHARDKMEAEGLFDDDVVHAVRRAQAMEVLRDDARGPRYKIKGPALDGRRVEVVCRFDERGHVRFITLWSFPDPP